MYWVCPVAMTQVSTLPFLEWLNETNHRLKFSPLILKVSKFICLASFQSLMWMVVFIIILERRNVGEIAKKMERKT